MGDVKNLRDGVEGLQAFLRTTAFGGSRDRPYLGQPWTWTGDRGRLDVPPMNMRTLGDIIVRALDDYPWNRGEPDLDAVAQTILLRIEDEFSMPEPPQIREGDIPMLGGG